MADYSFHDMIIDDDDMPQPVRAVADDTCAALPAEREALDDRSWSRLLQRTDKGAVKTVFFNALVALSRSLDWNGCFCKNAFTQAIIIKKPLPHEKTNGSFSPRPMTDIDTLYALEWLHERKIHVSISDVERAIRLIASESTIHPVRDYLQALEWDGVERAHQWLSLYMGVRQSDYTEAVSCKMLVAAVARVMQPGCQSDAMVIIEGTQGIGKSSGIKALMPHMSWYTDLLPDITSKDACLQLNGIWILEHAELSGKSKSELEAQKAFITRRSDRYRPPYERQAIDVPRQVVFIGTTNRTTYLEDETGARRYWPVTATKIDVKGIERIRDQLWAEAFHLWKTGMQWHLTRREEDLAKVEQAMRFEADVWSEQVEAYLVGKTSVTISEVLSHSCLAVPVEHRNKSHANRVGAILRANGYELRQDWARGENRGRKRFCKVAT